MENERMLILQMVAEKKITVAEGVELLKALEPKKSQPRHDGHEAPAAPGMPAAPGATWQPPRVDLPEDFGSKIGSLVESIIGNFGFGFGDGYRFEETFEGSFGDVAGPVAVDFATHNGRISVEGWDQPGYMVKLIKRVRAPSEQEANARADQIASVIREPAALSVRMQGSFPNLGMAIIAYLPKDRIYSFKLNATNGRIEATGLKGTVVEARTANGVVKLDAVGAERVEARTSNGKVLLRTSATDVTAHSSNGKIIVIPEDTMGDARYDLSTSNGSIRVKSSPPDGARFEFDLRTTHGEVRLQAPDLVYEVNEKHHGMRRVKARSGGFEQAAKKISVSAHTSNGSIVVDELVTWE